MTLSSLKHFVTAAKHRNITRAAEELSVSQPGVSQAIKSLEDEFGTRLIFREKAGFTLTEDGEELFRRGAILLNMSEKLSEDMTQRGLGRLRVRVGLPPMIGNLMLDSILSELPKRYPELSVSFKEGGREELTAELKSGRLDMAFLSYTGELPDCFSSLHIKREETVLAVSKESPLADLKSVTPKMLQNEPLALFAEGYFITERIMRLFSDSGTEPNVMHTSRQLSALIELISAGIASGFLFESIVLGAQGIVPVRVEPRLFTDLSLVWLKDGYVSEGMRKFKTLIGDIE